MCEMALSGLSQGSEEAMLLAHLVLTTVTKTCSRTSELQEESVVDHRRDEPYVVYIPVCWSRPATALEGSYVGNCDKHP